MAEVVEIVRGRVVTASDKRMKAIVGELRVLA